MKKLGAGKKVKLVDVFAEESPRTTAVAQVQPVQGMFLNVPVDELKPNPYQPRQIFDEEELVALANSIEGQGVLLPLCIFIENGTYFIGDGERRWRASRMAGKKSVPCYVTTGNPAEVALIGNMLRSDLSPLEEAAAYARMQTEFGYTHQELAKVVGKSRNNITETLSLNKLPAAIKEECLRVDIAKRKLIKVARMETPEAMEEAVKPLLGKKEAKPEKPRPSNVAKMSVQVKKMTGEIRKVSLSEGKSTDAIALVMALRDLKTEIETLSSMGMNMNSGGGGQEPEEGLHLTGTCRGKLIDAGFRLFRASECEKLIKELSPTGSWKLVGRYTTKKAMKEAMDEILKDPMSVRD
ncbi:hypothetical protein DSLASN_01830 [Desulfoluna limicola]|uniref:ParB-like N-terminal domain-containing protein n=1 Tax=Desulfoluna limicola TaxID=2810562 RepID=A0ABN6EZ97_9BACT|nr:ParB/RepB/Spo0J family partition protein [Desulfoluna limicola]BCS94551.1 hypothetical protein DSLASN_01830 [Desulfoluna limicola]